MSESEITLSSARAQLGLLVERAHNAHEPVYLSRRGKRLVAIVDASDYEQLIEQAEDLDDLRAAAQARQEMAETGETPVPWAEVKADLGLV